MVIELASPDLLALRINIPGWDWQIAIVTQDGHFHVCSDRGNYSHYWVNWGGGDFFKFLSEIHPGYLEAKLAVHKSYQHEETLKRIKEVAENEAREGHIGPAQLKQVEEWVDSSGDLDTLLEEEFDPPFGDIKSLQDLVDPSDIRVYGPCRDLVVYCWDLFPQIQQTLKTYLAGKIGKVSNLSDPPR